MDIQFNQFPVNFYVPGTYAEFSNANANPSGAVTVPPAILLIGQMLTGSPATADVVAQVFSADQVGQLCGRGSMLHQMAKKLFGITAFVPVYILPLADAVGSVAATQSLTISGPATNVGEIDLYLGDSRYPIGVNLNDSAGTIATNIVAAIQADTDRYFNAVVNGTNPAEVNLTARNAGADAGDVLVTLNRYTGEALPAGVGVVIGTATAGVLNPTVNATLYGTLGETWYPSLVMPYTDAANLAALKVEEASRFGPTRQIDSYNFCSLNTTLAALVALAPTDNSPWNSIIDAGDLLTPAYVAAAAVAAVDAAEPDPSRPRHTLPLTGVLAKANVGRRMLSDRNTLLAAGISTLAIANDGTVSVGRLTSTYRTDSYGVTDDSYFDVTTLHTLMNIRYTTRVRFATKYPRSKLGQNGTIGANVVTPAIATAEMVSLYRDTWMDQGWVEGGAALTQFKTQVVAQINSTDPNRLDMQLPPNLINGLDVVAALIDFIR